MLATSTSIIYKNNVCSIQGLRMLLLLFLEQMLNLHTGGSRTNSAWNVFLPKQQMTCTFFLSQMAWYQPKIAEQIAVSSAQTFWNNSQQHHRWENTGRKCIDKSFDCSQLRTTACSDNLELWNKRLGTVHWMAVDNALNKIVADKNYTSSQSLMSQPASKTYAGTTKRASFTDKCNLQRSITNVFALWLTF